jgi:predicted acylesterase/phospholipase RssA
MGNVIKNIAEEMKRRRTQVRRIIDGEEKLGADACLKMAKQLKNDKDFGLARQLLEVARQSASPGEIPTELARDLRHQHALCTYKDGDSASEPALDNALKILGSDASDPLETSTDQETLGIAGAIHKRKWEIDGDPRHLRRSLSYYERGLERGFADNGYTAVNTAFVLDLLAAEEETEGVAPTKGPDPAGAHQNRAAAIRHSILTRAESLWAGTERPSLAGNWWFLATVAEAHFGLGNYEQAGEWLRRGKESNKDGLPEWELESTVRQLATLARLQSSGRTLTPSAPAFRTLIEFMDGNAAAVQSGLLGKVGLALSGGGFRAALFHIGVLAHLAELDVLRHVEVLSCVSGGSIVGAHYYLELKRALEATPDRDMSREEYVRIVENVLRGFVAGVQTNIRNRAFLGFGARRGNRTVRVGRLLESEIYQRVEDGNGRAPRLLRRVGVNPQDWGSPAEQGPFHPKRHNWRRSAKAPILIINATTLNTGHNWQFTANWVGEPPTFIERSVDANYRLRRLYHEEAPPPHDALELGQAVAASACVPGLFRPIVLNRLYPGRVVRLVDGGVHDNQGVFGLMEQDCRIMLISDGSGQMGAADNPPWWGMRVPMRSNEILMASVRRSYYRILDDRRKSLRLREMMYVHLKNGLHAEDVNWLRRNGCPISARTSAKEASPSAMPQSIQLLLARLRTDLDRFSKTEAHALMLSGYRIAKQEFAANIKSIPVSDAPAVKWEFLEIEAEIDARAEDERHRKLCADLKCGEHLFARGLRSRAARFRGWTLGIRRALSLDPNRRAKLATSPGDLTPPPASHAKSSSSPP